MDAEIAIEARLRTEWADRCPIFTENKEGEQPESGNGFLTLQFPFSDPQRWSVGTRLYREEGGFRIVMSVPRDTGITKLRQWGEILRTMFLDVKFSGVECFVPSGPQRDDRSDAGPYYVAYMAVPYAYQWRVA